MNRLKHLASTLGYAPAAALLFATFSFGQQPSSLPHFEDVTEASGIRQLPVQVIKVPFQLPDVKGSGAAWGDYDGDGDFDLYVIDPIGPFRPEAVANGNSNTLYRNNGDGTFTDITRKAGVGYQGWGRGASWADHDADGDLDLFLTNIGLNLLYRNEGNGTFSDATREARLGGGAQDWSAASSWGDFDGDGDLDLYVCNYVNVFRKAERLPDFHHHHGEVPMGRLPQSFVPQPNLFFRNNGDGTFSEVSRELGVDNPEGRSLAATFADFDNDGWVDLLIGNDVSDNVFYRNLGGRFEDVTLRAGVRDSRGSMGLAVGDYNNDGWLDFFLSYWYQQQNALYQNWSEQLGELFFADSAERLGLGAISYSLVGWGVDFLDFDNDGWLDLLIVNGHTFEDPKQPGTLTPLPFTLFKNRGQDGFDNVTHLGGPVMAQPISGRGAAFADYDSDGDIDVFVTQQFGPSILLRNEGGNRQEWLQVRLRGKAGNPQARGARVKVQAGGLNQMREIGAGVSFLSQNSSDAHFGLANARQADLVTVIWPDGTRTELRSIAARRRITIHYGGEVELSDPGP